MQSIAFKLSFVFNSETLTFAKKILASLEHSGQGKNLDILIIILNKLGNTAGYALTFIFSANV